VRVECSEDREQSKGDWEMSDVKTSFMERKYLSAKTVLMYLLATLAFTMAVNNVIQAIYTLARGMK
jgi:hypothetical protein